MGVRLPLQQQLQLLAALRVEEVPQLLMLPGDSKSSDSRYMAQRACDGSPSADWLAARRGVLTAGSFATAMGFSGEQGARELRRALRGGGGGGGAEDYLSAAPASPSGPSAAGKRWGMRHERSGLLTYITGWLSHACPEARVAETGFWPFTVGGDCGRSLRLGASPDAIVHGAERLCDGGSYLIEVKCPFNGGEPRAHERPPPSVVPQLQGALLATGLRDATLVSWSPYGTAIFWVRADADYQAALLHAVKLWLEEAVGGGGVGGTALSGRLRLHSQHVAERAELVGFVPETECVRVKHTMWPY